MDIWFVAFNICCSGFNKCKCEYVSEVLWSLFGVCFFAAGGVAGTALIKHMCDIIHENRIKFILTDILCRIGRNSMPILALHCFLFSICDIFIDRLGITVVWPLGYSILQIIIVVIACIGVARCLHFKEKRLVR